MNIGIDVSSLAFDRGVSRYTANLLTALLKKETNITTYASSFRGRPAIAAKLKKIGVPASKQIIERIPPTLLGKLWAMGFHPITSQLPKIDVFHSWDWMQPPDKNLALVSTIHDLALLKYPETAHPKIRAMHEESWKILKKRKARIIAVSNSTKQDIIDLLDIPPSLIDVAYEALPNESIHSSTTLSEEKYETIKQHLGLMKPFLLFVGTREPRKNLTRLIKAWEPLANDFDLIIAGEAGWDETKNISKKASESLRFLGKVSDQTLVVLYGEASVFVYPSLYEGFGLPILEAFYHGTPVVTSNTSAMPEVAGNAAYLIEPESITSIREGIETILNETNRQQQERLQKMIIRLQMFSWDRAAHQTLEVYKKAVQSK